MITFNGASKIVVAVTLGYGLQYFEVNFKKRNVPMRSLLADF